MEPSRHGPKPDETDSSPVKNRLEGQDRTETTKTGGAKVTASRLPAKAAASSTTPEKDEEEEYILEREPDGRYRIVGRQARKKKKTTKKN